MNSGDFAIKICTDDTRQTPFCAICSETIVELTPYGLCLYLVDAPVCHSCGVQHAPELQGVLDLALESIPEYWGACPDCGKTGGCLNVDRDHWFVCHEHKTRWCVGSNLFSGWREETEAQWRRNARELAGYREVNPVAGFRRFAQDAQARYLAHKRFEAEHLKTLDFPF